LGVDETPTSYTAVDHAAIEAELHGWDLRLFRVQRASGARYPSRDEGAPPVERMTDRVHAYSPTVIRNIQSSTPWGGPASSSTAAPSPQIPWMR
jgi:hypothetical protein